MFQLEVTVLDALAALAASRSTTLDALAGEAFRDLLRKHRQPVTMRDALSASLRRHAANDRGPARGRARR